MVTANVNLLLTKDSDGDVTLEWIQKDRRLLITFSPDGGAHFIFVDRNTNELDRLPDAFANGLLHMLVGVIWSDQIKRAP
jgi:hypothetical protein